MRTEKEELEKLVEELAGRLTLEEKISMIHGAGLFRTGAVERLGIPALVMSDGPMGPRMQFPDDSWIPCGYSDDYTSYSVSNSALAATWNKQCAYESGVVLGEEARGRGKDVILAPGINIKRDPLCGRNFEYMSEDPCLVENLVVPFVEGVQKSDVAACVKHFAVNGQETDRFMVDTVVEERALREIYLPGFLAAVKEGCAYSLMNAYNKVNGAHCSENKELLDIILREEWGYDGTVISDWGSVHRTRETAEVSMDVEMSVTADFQDYHLANPLLEAVRKGEIAEENVDKKVKNILRMMYRLKMIGSQAMERCSGAYNAKGHQNKIYHAAAEGIVLLKNEEELLPITEQRLRMQKMPGMEAPKKRRIAVIGHNAEQLHAAGGGSAEIKALYEISPLMGLKKELGGNVEVVYAQGYYIPGKKEINETNWQEASLERQVMSEDAEGSRAELLRREILENRWKYQQEALELAATADEVIFIGGLNHDYDIEGRDRTDMKLPYGQDELIEALLDIKPDTIVVMVAGSPVEMPWVKRTKALVWTYYAGMETGTALTDVLLGKVNPSGKLPETFPVSYTDTVTAKNGEFGREGRIELKEGIFVGYRYYEKEAVQPAFAFGHGLSYSQFVLHDMQIQIPQRRAEALDDLQAVVTVRVTNAGTRAGAEVVQCYVEDVECRVERPRKELKGFEKIFLQPQESVEVTMKLPRKAFAFYDVSEKAFVIEPGEFVIWVGNASDACSLKDSINLS